MKRTNITGKQLAYGGLSLAVLAILGVVAYSISEIIIMGDTSSSTVPSTSSSTSMVVPDEVLNPYLLTYDVSGETPNRIYDFAYQSLDGERVPVELTKLSDQANGRFNKYAFSTDKTQVLHFSDSAIEIASTEDFSFESLELGLPENELILDAQFSVDGSELVFVTTNTEQAAGSSLENPQPVDRTVYTYTLSSSEATPVYVYSEVLQGLRIQGYDSDAGLIYWFETGNGGFNFSLTEYNIVTEEPTVTEIGDRGTPAVADDLSALYTIDESSSQLGKVDLEILESEVFFESPEGYVLDRIILKEDTLFVTQLVPDTEGLVKRLSTIDQTTGEETVLLDDWNFGQGAGNDSLVISPDGSQFVIRDETRAYQLYTYTDGVVDLVDEVLTPEAFVAQWFYRSE